MSESGSNLIVPSWFQVYLIEILTSSRDRLTTTPFGEIIREVDTQLGVPFNHVRLTQDEAYLLLSIATLGTEFNALLERWRETPPNYEQALEDLHVHVEYFERNGSVLAQQGMSRSGPLYRKPENNSAAGPQANNAAEDAPRRRRGRPTNAEVIERAARSEAATRYVVLTDLEHEELYGSYPGYQRATMGEEVVAVEFRGRILPFLPGTELPDNPVDGTAPQVMGPPLRATSFALTTGPVPKVTVSAAPQHQVQASSPNFSYAARVAHPAVPILRSNSTPRSSASPFLNHAPTSRNNSFSVSPDPNTLPPNPFSTAAVEPESDATSHVQLKREELPYHPFRTSTPSISSNTSSPAPKAPPMVPTQPAQVRGTVSHLPQSRPVSVNRRPGIEVTGVVSTFGVLVPSETSASASPAPSRPATPAIARILNGQVSHKILPRSGNTTVQTPAPGYQAAWGPGQNQTMSPTMDHGSLAGASSNQGQQQRMASPNLAYPQPQANTHRSPPRAIPVAPMYSPYQHGLTGPYVNQTGGFGTRSGPPSFYRSDPQARQPPPPGPYHCSHQQQQQQQQHQGMRHGGYAAYGMTGIGGGLQAVSAMINPNMQQHTQQGRNYTGCSQFNQPHAAQHTLHNSSPQAPQQMVSHQSPHRVQQGSPSRLPSQIRPGPAQSGNSRAPSTDSQDAEAKFMANFNAWMGRGSGQG